MTKIILIDMRNNKILNINEPDEMDIERDIYLAGDNENELVKIVYNILNENKTIWTDITNDSQLKPNLTNIYKSIFEDHKVNNDYDSYWIISKENILLSYNDYVDTSLNCTSLNKDDKCFITFTDYFYCDLLNDTEVCLSECNELKEFLEKKINIRMTI